MCPLIAAIAEFLLERGIETTVDNEHMLIKGRITNAGSPPMIRVENSKLRLMAAWRTRIIDRSFLLDDPNSFDQLYSAIMEISCHDAR